MKSKKKISRELTPKSKKVDTKSLPWLYFLIIFVILTIVYLPAISNGFVWDDNQLILENKQLENIDNIPTFFTQDFWVSELSQNSSDYYRPLVMLTYATDYALYGTEPTGFHITNILIHILVTISLFYLLYKILKIEIHYSLFLSLIFGLHPILAESVAWISGRTDSLSTLFLILCLIFNNDRTILKNRILSLLFLTMALLSKEIAVIIPFIAISFDWINKISLKESIKNKLDMFAILVLYFLVRWAVLGSAISNGSVLFSDLNILTRDLALPHLVSLVIIPMFGRIEYGANLPPSSLMISAIVGIVLLLVLLFFFIRYYIKKKQRRYVAFFACFILTLLPVFVSTLLKGVIGVRLIYLSLVFLIPLLFFLINGKIISKPKIKYIFIGLILVLGIYTFQKSSLWKSDITLFEVAASDSSPSSRINTNLGIAYHDEGMLQKSYEQFNLAISKGNYNLSQAYYMLGLLFTEIGCYNYAENNYKKALESQPNYESASVNLAGILSEQGKFSEAKTILLNLRLHSINNSSTEANIRFLENKKDTVIENSNLICDSTEEYIQRFSNISFLNQQALSKFMNRQLEQAEVLLKACLLIDPNYINALLNSVQLYILKNEYEEAQSFLDKVLTLDPTNKPARDLTKYIEAMR